MLIQIIYMESNRDVVGKITTRLLTNSIIDILAIVTVIDNNNIKIPIIQITITIN